MARIAALERQAEEQSEGIVEEDVEKQIEDEASYHDEFGLEMVSDDLEARSYIPHSGCEIKHETVTVVKQVPSFTKHCQKVEDTKCKTIYKNAFTTQMETQCMATFDTSCDTNLQTAYKQQCKTITDVECRIVNLESQDGHHESKKICEDVPTEKCIPVPVKVEGQKCVNVPTQMCENVPVTVSVEVPQQQCYKKPRKVCQTLVSTKPKVVTAEIPREVCGHEASPSRHRPEKAKPKGVFPPPSSQPSFASQSPAFRPSLKSIGAGVEKNKETYQRDIEESGADEYDYQDDEDEENQDRFSFPRGQVGSPPNSDGFDSNLLQFLKQNN